MAQDYDEARPEVAEASQRTLKALQQMDAPSAMSVQADLEEADLSEGTELPGAMVLDELVVGVVPQGSDEFVCGECFALRHQSQITHEFKGVKLCRACAEL